MMHYGFGLFGGGMFFMMLIPLLLIGIIVYAAVRLSMKETRNNTVGLGSDHAISILNERLARGEIGEDEYQQKKLLLQKR